MTKWRYYGRSSGTAQIFEIYRWPDNGLKFSKQEQEDVQLLQQDGSWSPNQRLALLKDLHDGWFNPHTDEMTAGQVEELYQKWLQDGWPGSKK